jgi:MFS transporter, CP family, cyanate transporter
MEINAVKRPLRQTRIRGLLLIVGIVLVASTLRVPITTVGPLIGEIQEFTGLSNTYTGILTSLPLLAFAVFSPLVPRISRIVGMEVSLFFGLILLTAGMLLRLVPYTPVLFMGTLIIGLAITVGNVLLPSLIKRDFSGRIGTMTGAYSTSMNVFSAIASGISVPLSLQAGLGWSGSLVCWVILPLMAILCWLPLLRQNHIPTAAAGNGKSMWRSTLAWQVTIFIGMQSLLFFVVAAWLPEILQAKGLGPETAGWMLSILIFVGIPVSFATPIFAERMKDQRFLAAGSAVMHLVGYAGLLWGSADLMLHWIIVIGIAGGAGISLGLTLFGLRTRNAQQAAELSGMAQSVGYLLASIGPVLAGILHDATGSWSYSLMLLMITSALLLFAGIGAGRRIFIS